MSLYNAFSHEFNNGNDCQWIKAPNTRLTEDSIDMKDWREERDFTHISEKFQMAIDGA